MLILYILWLPFIKQQIWIIFPESYPNSMLILKAEFLTNKTISSNLQKVAASKDNLKRNKLL